MEKKIIELLRENARLSSAELAERCGCGEAEVEKRPDAAPGQRRYVFGDETLRSRS